MRDNLLAALLHESDVARNDPDPAATLPSRGRVYASAVIANLLVRGREVWYLPVRESKEQIRRGDFLGVRDLIEAIQASIHNYNQQAGPFIWTEVPSYFRITALATDLSRHGNSTLPCGADHICDLQKPPSAVIQEQLGTS